MKIIKSPLAVLVALYLLTLFSCVPKEEVVFKGVSDIVVDVNDLGKPVLKGNGYFFNPNKVKMKLKEVNVEILVDGTKSAMVKHDLDVTIPAKSDFSVPIVAELVLQKNNLLDAVVGLLGGKKYEVVFHGYIRIRVHGIAIKVPVSQKQELKLNI